jgi:hypothetical protein
MTTSPTASAALSPFDAVIFAFTTGDYLRGVPRNRAPPGSPARAAVVIGPLPRGSGPVRLTPGRTLLLAARYLDLPGRRLRGSRRHGRSDLQHPVLVGGSDVLLPNAVGQGEPPDE